MFTREDDAPPRPVTPPDSRALSYPAQRTSGASAISPISAASR